MTTITLKLFLLCAVAQVFSASTNDKETISFHYPKNKDTKITLTTDRFNNFKEEWRGEDYYFIDTQGEGGLICSVLFYKLNKKESKDLSKIQKQSGVPQGSPIFPLAHFSSNSNTKPYESNEANWGDAESDFMFRQVDIKEYAGQQINQKHMYAYTMLGNDIYVKVHLSKVLFTTQDSTVMRQILDGIRKER